MHDSEANACSDLLVRVTREDHVFFELVAGPAPAATADEEFDDWLRRRGVTRSDLNPADWKSTTFRGSPATTGGATS